MRDAFVRYKMYLALKQEHKDKFLVPCYDIDLVWHTHQVHPTLYYQDTMKILGFVLKHDDSVNDRAPGSKLNQSDEVTRKLWMSKFQVSRRFRLTVTNHRTYYVIRIISVLT